MPFLQKATNNYFGFMPATGLPGTMAACNPYLVSSSEGAIFNGDVVMMTTLDTVRSITGAFTPTSSAAILGVAAQFLAANGGSTAATLSANTSQMCLVYDEPLQQFTACDTTSGIIGPQTGVFKNYVILASGAVGSTGPNTVSLNRSVMAISGVTATAVGAFHVIGLHPVEGGVYSTVAAATAATSSEVRKWIGVFVNQVTMESSSLLAVVNTTS